MLEIAPISTPAIVLLCLHLGVFVRLKAFSADVFCAAGGC